MRSDTALQLHRMPRCCVCQLLQPWSCQLSAVIFCLKQHVQLAHHFCRQLLPCSITDAGHVQLDLGKDRVLPLASVRGRVRPVILAGSEMFIKKVRSQAADSACNCTELLTDV